MDEVRKLVSPEKKTLEDFMGTTGCVDRNRAAFFVSGADGILERAVNHYFDFDAPSTVAGGAGASASGGGGVGGGGAATVVDDAADCDHRGGVADDADDEREESDENENDDHAAGAGASSESGIGAAGGGRVPVGLSEREHRRRVDEHNKQERMLYRQELEAARVRAEQLVREEHLRRQREGKDGGGAGTAFVGGNAPAGAAGAAGAAASKTVSPPSSPAEVLGQELDYAFEGRGSRSGGGGAGAAGMAGATGAFCSSSFGSAGTLISGLRSLSPPRVFRGGGGGGDGMDAAVAVVAVEHPTSANVLPCLTGPPVSPLKLGPGEYFIFFVVLWGWGWVGAFLVQLYTDVPCLLA